MYILYILYMLYVDLDMKSIICNTIYIICIINVNDRRSTQEISSFPRPFKILAAPG